MASAPVASAPGATPSVADVLGIPVVRVAGDAAAAGVAMLAGIGAGIYRDAREAIGRAVRLDERIEPDPATRSVYDDGYEAWRRLASAAVVRREA